MIRQIVSDGVFMGYVLGFLTAWKLLPWLGKMIFK